jgi:hypothetical protein
MPNCSRFYPPRAAQYDIRHPTYERRTTSLISLTLAGRVIVLWIRPAVRSYGASKRHCWGLGASQLAPRLQRPLGSWKGG